MADPQTLVFGLEICRLVVTLIIDITCTVHVWKGTLPPGYGTAVTVFKDWISELAIEPEAKEQDDKEGGLVSDMLRDLHCFADMIVCVALSINEAQVSVNPSIQVGISVKIAIAGGCAFHVPMIVCLFATALEMKATLKKRLKMCLFAVSLLFNLLHGYWLFQSRRAEELVALKWPWSLWPYTSLLFSAPEYPEITLMSFGSKAFSSPLQLQFRSS